MAQLGPERSSFLLLCHTSSNKALSPKQSFSDVKSMQGTTGIKIDAVEPEISSSFIPHITLSWQNLAPALPTMQHNH